MSQATSTCAAVLLILAQRRSSAARRCGNQLGLVEPKAQPPAAPRGPASSQVELPDFWQYAAALEEASAV